MGLYAIGDLHLHFQSELKAYNQLHDRVWKGHEKKFVKNCAKIISDDDTLVLVGDHSWGRKLKESEKDLQYIMDLPGRKVLLRGNHDMFWDVKKTESLNMEYKDRLFFLQNNYYPYEDYALVGTKGFTFEGPFYIDHFGRIIGWDETAEEQAKKLVARESERLRQSFESAVNDGFTKFIMFLHYPPTNILEKESVFTAMADEYRPEQVIYAHSHGESRFYDSIMGEKNGIRYSLVSGDFLKWMPMKVI
ncbi:MAG: metallophosphoesterase [Lachnospiraceae bacterium]|nr:metallophosphoesterase [Lachnospiraceae bacterium]